MILCKGRRVLYWFRVSWMIPVHADVLYVGSDHHIHSSSSLQRPHLQITIVCNKRLHATKRNSSPSHYGPSIRLRVVKLENLQPIDVKARLPLVLHHRDIVVRALRISNIGDWVGTLRYKIEPRALPQVCNMEPSLLRPSSAEIARMQQPDITRMILGVAPIAGFETGIEDASP
jgi:hypothetical protein